MSRSTVKSRSHLKLVSSRAEVRVKEKGRSPARVQKNTESYLGSLYKALNSLATSMGKTADELVDEYWSLGELEESHIEAHKLYSEISAVTRQMESEASHRRERDEEDYPIAA